MLHHPSAPAGVWVAPTGMVARCFRGHHLRISKVRRWGPRVLVPGLATNLWFPIRCYTGKWAVIRVNIEDEEVDVLGQPPSGEVDRTLQWVTAWLDRDTLDTPLSTWPRREELSDSEGWQWAGSVAWACADWITSKLDVEPPAELTVEAQQALILSCREYFQEQNQRLAPSPPPVPSQTPSADIAGSAC